MKKTILYILAAVTISSSGNTQQRRQLTYEESLITATQSSFTFKRQELEFKSNYFWLQHVRASLKSNAYMAFDLPNFQETRDLRYIPNPDGTGSLRFVSTKTMRLFGKLRISQPLSTGGDFSLNSDLTYRDQSGVTEYFAKLYLEFSQPILEPNQLKNNIKEAEWSLKERELSYAQSKAGSLSWLTSRFFNMFNMQEQIKYNEDMVAQYSEAYSNAEIRKNRGELDETELLILQVDLENIQADLVKLRTDLENGEEDFKQSVGIDMNESIEVVSSIDYKPVLVTVEDAIDIAMKNRVEIVRSQISLERQKIKYDEQKSEGGLTGEIVLRLGFDNNKADVSQLFENYLDSQNIVFKFELPIVDWGKNDAKLEEIQLGMDKTKFYQINLSRQIVREVTDAHTTVREKLGSLSILEASQDDSERSYELTLEQFNRNESTAQELRLARQRYIDNKNRYFEAFVDYQEALANLNSNTMWDFQNGRSLVTEEEIRAIITAINENNNED